MDARKTAHGSVVRCCARVLDDLLIVARELRRPHFESELIELASEPERHLIVLVVHWRAGRLLALDESIKRPRLSRESLRPSFRRSAMDRNGRWVKSPQAAPVRDCPRRSSGRVEFLHWPSPLWVINGHTDKSAPCPLNPNNGRWAAARPNALWALRGLLWPRGHDRMHIRAYDEN